MATFEEQISGNAEDYINDESIEMAWAIKAYQYAEVHMKLLCSTDPKTLKLAGNHDDEIHTNFMKEFGADFPLEKVDEELLKSADAKKRWREFAEAHSHVADFAYGSILRIDASGGYDQDNTIFVNRIQLLAIEIARNRAGINSAHVEKFRAMPKD